jgi:uncharacterized membrane protein
MSLLKIFGIVFAAYVTAGRTGAILACLLVKYSWWETLAIAFLIDLCQLPLYWFLIETSSRYIPVPARARQWFQKIYEKATARFQSDFWTRGAQYKPLAVMAVSGIPMKGFGVLSASILAALFKFNRRQSALWIMLGSLIGAGLTVAIFYLPLKSLLGS